MLGASLPPLSYTAMFWIAAAVGIGLLVYGLTSAFNINLGFATFTLPQIPNRWSRGTIIALGVVCFVLARWAYVKNDAANNKADYDAFVERADGITAKAHDDYTHRRAYERIWALANGEGSKQCYVLNGLTDGNVDWIPMVVINTAHDGLPADATSCMTNLHRMLLKKHMDSQAVRWKVQSDAARRLSQREIAAGNALYGFLVPLTPTGTEGHIYLGELSSAGATTFAASNINRDRIPHDKDEVEVSYPLNVDSEALTSDHQVGAVIGVIAPNAHVKMLEEPVVKEHRFAWGRVRLLTQPEAVVVAVASRI